jgi:hypothetical protein
MTDRKRKPSQRRPATSYRAPSRQQPERSGGFLDRFAPRAPVSTAMPRIRTSFTRGVTVVLATPQLVVGVPVVVLAAWLGLIAAGFQGPFAFLASMFAVPPISTELDVTLAPSVLVQPGGTGVGAALAPLSGIAAFIVLSAALQAIVTTVAVERLRTGGVTSWAARRAIHVLPVTIGVGVANLGALIAARFGQFLGAGLGLLLAIGILVAGLYLFAFAPAIAADEDHPLPFTMAKSVRAARMPGSNNLLLATIVVVPSLALFLATGFAALPGSTIDVNPSVGAWVTVILINLIHMAVVAMFAFRYLSVAHVVPDAPATAARSRR